MTMSPGPGARRDVLRNRALLLETADRLIAEHGLEVSFNAIAKQAGVGVGTVYRHFASRDDLVSALMEDRVDAVAGVLEAAGHSDDPVRALHDAMLDICELQAGDRGLWQALGGTARHRESIRDRLVPLTARLVERARATGRIRPDFSTTDVEIVLWTGGALSGYVGVVGRGLWRRYVEALLSGLVGIGAEAPDRPTAPPTFDELDRIVAANAAGRAASS